MYINKSLHVFASLQNQISRIECEKIVFPWNLENDFILGKSTSAVKNCECSSNFFIADILREKEKNESISMRSCTPTQATARHAFKHLCERKKYKGLRHTHDKKNLKLAIQIFLVNRVVIRKECLGRNPSE
jgi:hypothetical protein